MSDDPPTAPEKAEKKQEPYKYKTKTDEELKQIAIDYHAGKIFSDRHCKSNKDIPTVFMMIGLAGRDFAEDVKLNKLAFIYEYLSEAGPRSCNGMPMFMSVKFLDEDDYDKMAKYHDALVKAVEAL